MYGIQSVKKVLLSMCTMSMDNRMPRQSYFYVQPTECQQSPISMYSLQGAKKVISMYSLQSAKKVLIVNHIIMYMNVLTAQIYTGATCVYRVNTSNKNHLKWTPVLPKQALLQTLSMNTCSSILTHYFCMLDLFIVSSSYCLILKCQKTHEFGTISNLHFLFFCYKSYNHLVEALHS